MRVFSRKHWMKDWKGVVSVDDAKDEVVRKRKETGLMRLILPYSQVLGSWSLCSGFNRDDPRSNASTRTYRFPMRLAPEICACNFRSRSIY